MVLQNLSNLDERTASKYPGMSDYASCQSRAFVQGVLGMVVGGGAGAVATLTAKRYFPAFPSRFNVLYSAGAAILSGYVVTARASKKCQKNLVQSQIEKNSVEQGNLQANSVKRRLTSPKIAELASDPQRTTTLTTKKLLPDSGGD